MSALRLTGSTSVALLAFGAAGCMHAEGEFHAEGATFGSWTLVPDTCVLASRNHLDGADLYRNDEREDTELVVATAGFVLVRVPGQDKTIAFTKEDCRVLEYDLHWNSVRINRAGGLAGSVRLQCERPHVGKIEGNATFSCN